MTSQINRENSKKRTTKKDQEEYISLIDEIISEYRDQDPTLDQVLIIFETKLTHRDLHEPTPYILRKLKAHITQSLNKSEDSKKDQIIQSPIDQLLDETRVRNVILKTIEDTGRLNFKTIQLIVNDLISSGSKTDEDVYEDLLRYLEMEKINYKMAAKTRKYIDQKLRETNSNGKGRLYKQIRQVVKDLNNDGITYQKVYNHLSPKMHYETFIDRIKYMKSRFGLDPLYKISRWNKV